MSDDLVTNHILFDWFHRAILVDANAHFLHHFLNEIYGEMGKKTSEKSNTKQKDT